MDMKIQFATRPDGERVAYATVGKGPVLVRPPGWVGDVQGAGRVGPYGTYATERLAEKRTLVCYARHGCGLSDRNRTDFTLNDDLVDLGAVVAALGLDRFALLGISAAGQTSLAYAARNPDKVSRVAVYGTSAKKDAASDPGFATRRIIADLIRTDWNLASRTLADIFFPSGTSAEALAAWAGRIREAATPEVTAALWEVADDITDVLKNVTMPALVLHRRGDQVRPFDAGRRLAYSLPNARFVPLEGDMHGDFGEDVLSEIIAFLGEESSAETPSSSAVTASAFRTILFTDVEGHTAMMQRLGDAKGREVLREHERITRDALAAHGGAEVKAMGDGFMAAFGSAQRALECAVALQRAFSEREGAEPIRVRVGINAGEPIEEDADLFGTAVILAARTASKAQGGEILVTDLVRQLVAGKGFVFADRGDATLRGFEDPVRLFELSWS